MFGQVIKRTGKITDSGLNKDNDFIGSVPHNNLYCVGKS